MRSGKPSFYTSILNLYREGNLLEKKEIIEFVKTMKLKEHGVLLYTDIKDKHDVLFTYLKAGLERGEAAACIACQESPEQIREAMQEFGIDVKRYEDKGALKVIDYRDWYIVNGKFDSSRTLDLWRKIAQESESKGFRGLRVTGEVVCFFENNLVNELLDYEHALHRTLDIPMTAICAYDSKILTTKEEWFNVLIEILNTHSTAIMIGPRGVGVTDPRKILVKIAL
jgi:hypothetical protein